MGWRLVRGRGGERDNCRYSRFLGADTHYLRGEPPLYTKVSSLIVTQWWLSTATEVEGREWKSGDTAVGSETGVGRDRVGRTGGPQDPQEAGHPEGRGDRGTRLRHGRRRWT